MIYLLLFINIFCVYLYTVYPTVAAYRDSGEMLAVAGTLGIAHPPGYPLYTILANIFYRIVPFGNFAYRINIFSVLCSSITAVLLLYFSFNLEHKKYNNNEHKFIFYLLVLIFSFGYLQWYLSLVSEMYTLNTFFAVCILVLSFLYYNNNSSYFYLIVFVFGIGLTNRMDLILISPIVFFVFLDVLKCAENKLRIFLTAAFIFLLGLLCYSYLLMRSNKNPLLNWNNPVNFSRLWASLSRKTHGSTLDLLSTSYLPGENFFSGIKYYFSYLVSNVTFIGIFMAFVGLYNLWSKNKNLFFGFLLSWLFSSFWFIYKANMPPNPHSFAILEAHFLLPNVIFFFFIIFGVSYLKLGKKVALASAVVLSIIVGLNFNHNISKLNKRQNYFAYDYTVNLLAGIPKNSIMIIKEDVQIFSCWYRQYIEKFRNDVYCLALGLMGSGWYQEMIKRYLNKKEINSEIFITKLSSEEELTDFILKNNSYNGKIFVSFDSEIPVSKNISLNSFGLSRKVVLDNTNDVLFSKFLMEDVYNYRGRYVYDLEKDFFCSDLIEDYSKARSFLANEFLLEKNYDSAIEELKKSIILNPIYPANYFYLGYAYFSKNDMKNALRFYEFAVKKYKYYLFLAKEYNALEDTIEDFKRQTSNAYLHLGVVQEKNNNIDQAIESYNSAVELSPSFAEAYYNLAVAYWHKKDWPKVRFFFEKTLQLDPYHKQAKFYLEKLKNN